jgi:arylsulfatase A-like enzyme
LVLGTLGTLGALTACGDDPLVLQGGIGNFQRLALEADAHGQAQAPGETTLEQHLVPPPEITPWSVQAPLGAVFVPASTTADHKTEAGLMLRGEGEKVVSIPGPFDTQAFNQIALRGIFVESVVVRLQFLRKGKAVLGTRGQQTSSSRSPQLFIFEVPELRRQVRSVDEIRILVSVQSTRSVIQSLDLLRRPLESYLPAPGGEPGLVDINFDLRRGWGLTNRASLAGHATLLPGSRLRFSYGSVEALRMPRQAPTLRLTVTDEDGSELTESYTLEDGISTRSKWHAADIALDGLGEGEITVRFSLEVRRKDLGLCAVAEPVVYIPGAEAPTVLLITSDTHRADHLGVAGTNLVKTPALDALAARGVRFTDCLTATNVTNPSHIALMTATHPRDTRVVDNHHPLAQSAPTLAEAFRQAGYATYASISARHLVEEESGLGQGFDRMNSPAAHQRGAQITTHITSKWLDESAGLPLFIWLHLFDVHTPYTPPEGYDRRYYEQDKDPFSPQLPEPPFPPLLVSDTPLAGLRDPAFPQAQYRAEVDFLDDQLGALLAHERFGDALIVFTADHGESFGQHGVYYDHAELYPDTIHVPLIMAWPAGPRGTTSSAPVRQIDLGRTLLNLCGLEGSEFPGHDLRDNLDGTASADARFGLSSAALSASVNLDGWHLIMHLKDHHQKQVLEKREGHSVELYNLRQDPGCLENLARAHRERAIRMRALLVHWLAQAPAEGWSTSGNADPETIARLADLGYAGMEEGAGVGDWFTPDCSCVHCTEFAPPE